MIAVEQCSVTLDMMPDMNTTIKPPRQMVVHVSFTKEKKHLYDLLQKEAEQSGLKLSTIVTKALQYYFDYT
jgi:hypothetical protein